MKNSFKKIILLSIFLSAGIFAFARKHGETQKYGQTLNIGLGVGYYGYIGHSVPLLHLNYEIDIDKNFTLAPFFTYYTYTSYRYWNNPGKNNTPYNYFYKETAIPIGIKGFYYLDDAIETPDEWDFYIAGSLGAMYRKIKWEEGFNGETSVSRNSGNIYIDFHLGAEYHLSKNTGLYTDLSSTALTLGVAVHL